MSKKLSLLLAALSPVVGAEEIKTLADIDVYGVFHNPGKTSYNSRQIARQLRGNGTINELLRGNLAVQFSAAGQNSSQAGEISPEFISIHGEPYYNNALLLDGISNNDIMNPGSGNHGYQTAEKFTEPTSMYLAPGAPETFQVDSSLLKNLSVYDSNIPAKYSGFTGGVVDAELHDPDTHRSSGLIRMRTTRSDWTRKHLTDSEAADFDHADAGKDIHKEFVKRSYFLTLNQPISPKAGLIFGYTRTESKTPEHHLLSQQWKTEQRLAQTWLLKGLYRHSPTHTLTANLMYSPHSATYYWDNAKGGEYTSEGGGWRAQIKSEKQLPYAKMTSTAAFTSSRNRIAYADGYNFYGWLPNLPQSRIDWCSRLAGSRCLYAIEGGLGTLSSSTRALTFRQDYDFNTLEFGGLSHRINSGWLAEFARSRAERPNDVRYMFMYSSKNLGYPKNITNVAADCTDCIPGEQYQTRLNFYPAYDASASVNKYVLYFSDEIRSKHWKIVPGINIRYDSFLKNTNIAPRLAFRFDLFGDQRLQFHAGANRYYADSILAYALRSKIRPNEVYSRINDPQNGAGSWTFERTSGNSVRWSGSNRLKTPYSDELSAGADYTLGEHLLTAQFVRRFSHDQFTPGKDGEDNKIMTNGKGGQSNNFVFGIQRQSPLKLGLLHLNYRFGINYHRHRSGHQGTYDETLVADLLSDNTPYLLYEGKRYDSLGAIPAFNYNRPWQANLTLNTDIPKWHLTWTHNFYFRPGYSHYVRYSVRNCADSSQPQACGDWAGSVYDYRKTQFKKTLTWDTRLQFDLPIKNKQALQLAVDVSNVLNSKNAASSVQSSFVGGTERQSLTAYETGRQFWLEAAYRW